MSIAYPLQFLFWAFTTTGIGAALTLTAIALWNRPRRTRGAGVSLPPVTVLKPFDGVDAELEANFRSYLEVPYPAPRQLLLCTAADNVDGIRIAERVLATAGADVDARLLLAEPGEKPPSNRKVWHLQRGLRHATHPVVVGADSGTRLEPGTLEALVGALVEGPRRGMAWCAYTADARGGLGARFTRLAFTASALSFVVIAGMHRLLRRSPFVAGALFAVRREALDEIGGFEPFAHRLAEDLDMARRLVDRDWQVVLAPVSVLQVPGPGGIVDFFRRMVRWNVIMWRYRDPLRVHYPMVVCALPLSLLSLPAALAAYPGQWRVFATLLVALLASRVVFAAVLRGVVHRRRLHLDVLWALPVLETLMLASYVRALFVRTLRWRAQELTVHRGGRMERSGTPPHDGGQSR